MLDNVHFCQLLQTIKKISWFFKENFDSDQVIQELTLHTCFEMLWKAFKSEVFQTNEATSKYFILALQEYP